MEEWHWVFYSKALLSHWDVGRRRLEHYSHISLEDLQVCSDYTEAKDKRKKIEYTPRKQHSIKSSVILTPATIYHDVILDPKGEYKHP